MAKAVKLNKKTGLPCKKQGPVPMSIRVRGKTYANATEAGKALGVGEQAVRAMVRKGREDHIGTLGNRSPYNFPTAKPFKVGQTVFRSMAAASVALGMGKNYIRDVKRAGGPKAQADLSRRMLEYIAKQDRAAAFERKMTLRRRDAEMEADRVRTKNQ
jgi:hypothetical protein